MKRFIVSLAALATVIGLGVTAAPTATANGNCATHFAGRGAGTSGDPYQVASQLDLNEVRYCLSSHFLQTADITLSGDWLPIGNYVATQPFTGVYDGGNHDISNLTNTDPDVNPFGTRRGYGLFSSTDGATLKNVRLTHVSIHANWEFVGGLMGSSSGTTVENCQVTGDIASTTGSSMGGVTGLSGTSTFTNIHANVNVTGAHSLGAFGGQVYTLMGTDLTVEGNIESLGNNNAAGVVTGWSLNSDYINVTVPSGSVKGTSDVGGAFGWMGTYSLTDVTVHSDVQGVENVGGVIGSASNVSLTRIHATGSVQGESRVGGLVGALGLTDRNSTVESSSASGDVSSPASATRQRALGGLIGYVVPGQPIHGRVSVNESHSSGNIVFGNASIPGQRSGGLIGEIDVTTQADAVTVTNSYANGRISGATGEYVGGLAGYVGDNTHQSNDISFNRVYSASSVPNGTNVGGLFGSWGGFSLQGFWNPTAAAPTTVSAAGTETTAAQMREIATYSDQGWGIRDGWVAVSNVSWGICPVVNDGYPFLLREYTANPCVPGVPTKIVATPGDTSAKIAWSPPSNGAAAAITKYEYRLGEGEWTNAGSSPLALTGLTNGTTYSIQLRAVNSYGDGAASDPVLFVPAIPPAPAEPQTITPAPTWPKTLKHPGSTVIFKTWLHTNAGQRVHPHVTFSTLRTRPSGDVRLGKVILTKKGKLTVVVFTSKPVRVRVTLTAKATATYAALHQVKTYRLT